MNAKYLCSFVLMFSGCVGISPDREDKAASLAKFGSAEFSAPLVLGGKVLQIDKRQIFFNLTTATIVSIPSANPEFAHLFEQSIEENRNGVSSENLHPTIKKSLEDGSAGTAAAISGDGYFLTAKHVLNGTESYGLYMIENDQGDLVIVTKKCRIVREFEGIDLALIHLNIETPRFMHLTQAGAKPGTVAYSGSMVNGIGAGEILSISEEWTNGKIIYNRISSSIPVSKGDSGSPIIDESNRVLGISTHTINGRFSKKKVPESRGVSAPSDYIYMLIDNDRNRNKVGQ